MRVSNICKTDVVSISAEANLQQASILMKAKAVGCLIIIDDKENPIGLVTDRDLATKGMSSGVAPDCKSVNSIMSEVLTAVSEQTDLFDVIQLMKKVKIRRLVVTHSVTGKLYGIITADDVFKYLATQFNSLSEIYQFDRVNSYMHDFSRMS